MIKIYLISLFLIVIMNKTGAFAPGNSLRIDDTDYTYNGNGGFTSMFSNNGFVHVYYCGCRKTSSKCQTEPMWPGNGVLNSICYGIYDSTGNPVREPGLLFDLEPDRNLNKWVIEVQSINDSNFYILYYEVCYRCKGDQNLQYKRLNYAKFNIDGARIGNPFFIKDIDSNINIHNKQVLSNGRTVFTFGKYQGNVYGILFNSNGDLISGVATLSFYRTTNYICNPSGSVAHSNGNFVLSCIIRSPIDTRIVMQSYSNEGIPLGEPKIISYTSPSKNSAISQYYPHSYNIQIENSAILNHGDGFVVIYKTQKHYGEGSGNDWRKISKRSFHYQKYTKDMVEVGNSVTLFETPTDIYFLAKYFDNKYYIGAKLELTNLYANVYDSNFNIISENNWVKETTTWSSVYDTDFTGSPNQYGVSIITSIYRQNVYIERYRFGSRLERLSTPSNLNIPILTSSKGNVATETETVFKTRPGITVTKNVVYETISPQDTSAPQIDKSVEVIEEDVNEEKDLNININNNVDVKVENENISDSYNNTLVISISVPLSILSIFGILYKIYKRLKKRKFKLRNKTKATSFKATAPPPVVVGNSIPAYKPEYKCS